MLLGFGKINKANEGMYALHKASRQKHAQKKIPSLPFFCHANTGDEVNAPTNLPERPTIM